MKLRISFKDMRSGFAALRHRNFRLFFIGQCISLIGTWMQNLGQSWLVLEMTHSAFKLSLVTMLQFLPMMLFSLFAGTIIDRFPKRRLLLITQASMMILAFALAALTYFKVVEYWHVLVLALLLGLVNTIDMPTRQSYFNDLVGKEDLMNAIALNSSMFNLARIVGPAIAGFLISLVGIAICFSLNGLSFVAVLIGLWMINVGNESPLTPKIESVKQVIDDIKEGLHYINRHTLIKLPIILLALVNLIGMNYSVLMPLFSTMVLKQDAAGLGLIMSAMGLGSFTGAMIVAMNSKSGPSLRYIYIASVVTSLLMLVLGLESNFLLACITLFMIGLAASVFVALVTSIIQLNAKNVMRGRVMSVYSLVFGGFMPIGSLLTGGLTEWLGISMCMIVSGAMSVLSAIGTIAWLKPKIETMP